MTNEESGAATLDAATLAELRARLEQEEARLRDMLRSLAQTEQGGGLEDPVTIDPEDFGEMGQKITAQETDLALSANDQRLLAQVRHALERMDAGGYGVSEITGKPISLERLQALPWATTNVDDPAP